ncbi:MAG: phosphate signaling complex protein PhoU [Deltaproteobacteria bacterium]|nr:phosphate signaling complex protein PhoU [Deltaproteobacteria bacterium]
MDRQIDRELSELKKSLVQMAQLAEEAVRQSIAAVINRDSQAAEKVIMGDGVINSMENDINEQCLRLLALRQPLARDLRLITAAMRIITDVERIADQAVNIAERALELNLREPLTLPIDLKFMADLALEMVRNGIDAFIQQDPQLALQVWQRDVEVDTLDDEYIQKLLKFMLEETPAVMRAVHYIIIIRNLERIADLATNICEDIVFIVEGKVIRHSSE